MSNTCPNCNNIGLQSIYTVSNVPVHSVLLMNSQKEAIDYPKRNIELAYCPNCGFITNRLFDRTVHDYSSKYEETQGFSATFNRFHHALAKRLVKKHQLYNQKIIEIGCGKGDFITMLAEMGNNEGYGFDPAFIPQRNPDKHHRVQFIQDYYSEKYSNIKADFICCKMTLEHIPDTYDFIKMLRNSIDDNLDCKVFFQIPDTSRILKDLGFWDIYYEHCSYFTAPSLRYLFEANRFEVLDVDVEYDDQYLMVEAKPSSEVHITSREEHLNELQGEVNYFKRSINERLLEWRSFIKNAHDKGDVMVLWGGGSKAVAFLTTLGIVDEITYAVDINPFKQGTFLAGNGQEIISPQRLKTVKPNKVLVMNPIYIDEISRELDNMKLHPEILSVELEQKSV